jgi:hypothetical protein
LINEGVFKETYISNEYGFPLSSTFGHPGWVWILKIMVKGKLSETVVVDENGDTPNFLFLYLGWVN